MKIGNLFLTDINKTIETVIKAEDIERLDDEVVDYVATKEITKKISDFFHFYNNYSGINGVWISGFFGCGKSHLLKILAVTLENRECNGYKLGELFAEKIDEDEMLKGDILSATKIPSESILFNIDQQSSISNKSDENAVLSVFYKVFYDHLGFYGFQPYVAEFEMALSKKGVYEKFKDTFDEINDTPWNEARRETPFYEEEISEALGKVLKSDSSKYLNLLEQYEDRHKQSIDDFCNRVYEYIESKGNRFRLNFFVDEIGQYIADSTKLMLNLQTIAETLAVKTKGKSWIVVTSQSDMEKVVGDMNKSQQNDFSRILARFKIKIPLTSANIDEVIEKRLLKKEDEASVVLNDIYEKEKNHLESLLSFSETGIQFKGFQSKEDFSKKFPFVPYQFDLFQNARIVLSEHNAFQGRQTSVGERSMLSVFQIVIQEIKNNNEKTLVSFDLMFEGIRNELRPEIQNSITTAERQLTNKFAIRVLKALFMVKYYRTFETTKRNITVLLLDKIDIDLKKHEEDVSEALNLLENQNYIQRSGEIYEFLTNDEKDVEEEIKNTDIDDPAVNRLLKDIFFDEIIASNKLPYHKNGQSYDFAFKVDGADLSRTKELSIEIITDNYSDYHSDLFQITKNLDSGCLRLILPSDPVFIKDVKMYVQTEKYVKQNQRTGNKPELKRILSGKSQQNETRRSNLILKAKTLLLDSTPSIYNNSKFELNQSSDAKEKVIKAFQYLVEVFYPNLKMIGSDEISENSIRNAVVKNIKDELISENDEKLAEAETEILSAIKQRLNQSDRTYLKDLKDKFSGRGYGWYPNAIWYFVAKLYKRGKIELRKDSNVLENQEVVNALLNSANHSTTLVDLQTEFDVSSVKRLKQIYSDLFDESVAGSEPKEIARAFREKLKEMEVETNQILVKKNNYSFLEVLEDFYSDLEKFSHKDYNFFLTHFEEFEDKLLDFKEDVLNPIKSFMNGEQVKIYDSVKDFIAKQESNFHFFSTEQDLNLLKSFVQNSKPFLGNLVKESKSALDRIRQKIDSKLEEERNKAKVEIEKLIEDLKSKNEFKSLDSKDQELIQEPLKRELEKISSQNFISIINDSTKIAKEEIFTKQLNEMIRLAKPTETQGETEKPQIQYISKSNVSAVFSKNELATENDVDEYIEALRTAFKKQIQSNKRITL